MTDSDKALIVLRLMKRELELAWHEFRTADANYAATIAAHNVWKEHNRDDGIGMSSANPYNIEFVGKGLEAARDKMHKWDEAYQFAIETFMHKLDAGLADRYAIKSGQKPESVSKGV